MACFKGRLTERRKSTDPVSEKHELIQSGRHQLLRGVQKMCDENKSAASAGSSRGTAAAFHKGKKDMLLLKAGRKLLLGNLKMGLYVPPTGGPQGLMLLSTTVLL